VTRAEQTPEELQTLLNELGVESGEWQERDSCRVTPELVLRQRQKLERLRELLGGLVEQDQKSLAALKEQLARLQYGGGS